MPLSLLEWTPWELDWRSPTARPEWQADHIHVWHVNLAEILGEYDLLSKSEQDSSARLKNAQLRHRFVATRSSVRILLSLYTGQPPKSLAFTADKKGKPVLADFRHTSFNISHSNDDLLIAIGGKTPLGIDIETMAMQAPLEAIDSVFSPAERQVIANLAEPERSIAFYRIWTRKEAILKGLGSGFLIDPRSVTVCEKELSQDSPLAGWYIHDLQGFNQAAAALATPIDHFNIQYFRCFPPK